MKTTAAILTGLTLAADISNSVRFSANLKKNYKEPKYPFTDQELEQLASFEDIKEKKKYLKTLKKKYFEQKKQFLEALKKKYLEEK